jgi:pantoate kinase
MDLPLPVAALLRVTEDVCDVDYTTGSIPLYFGLPFGAGYGENGGATLHEFSYLIVISHITQFIKSETHLLVSDANVNRTGAM